MTIDQCQYISTAGTAGIASRPGRLWLWARAWIAAGLVVAAAGCAAPARMAPVPDADTTRAMPLGIAMRASFKARNSPRWRRKEGVASAAKAGAGVGRGRAVADGEFSRHFRRRRQRRVRFRHPGRLDRGRRSPRISTRDGSQHRRPDCAFAFLGPAYDRQLRDVYTTISADDVFSERGIIGGIFDDAMADTTPLWKLISRYVDEPMIAAIAREYEKGRLLLIGTTDLDAQRAASGTSARLPPAAIPARSTSSARSCARPPPCPVSSSR